MKKIFAFIAVSLFLVFSGCDKVLIPQQPRAATSVGDTVRRIFIEDFTGHYCPNCPLAAEMLDSVKNAFPGQVIGMGVHIQTFAWPCPPHGSVVGQLPNTFTEDFRIAEESEYNSIFGTDNFPLPTGFVNRYQALVTPTAITGWPPVAATELAKPITAYIKIIPTYNSATRALSVTVTGKFMEDTTGTFRIALFLTEDSLTGAQTDNRLPSPGIDNNYVFNHVCRGSINSPGSILGEQLSTGFVPDNTLINYTMSNSFTVNAAYDATHCKIIAILFQSSDYGVLQAAECELE
ncbi:MAG: Omp28-related outer membrane protein [Bacteroidota bacterium]|nr:Omp28-related outer membrane protein [Bacteroidota bacterium]